MRYLPLNQTDRTQMCHKVGVQSTDDFFSSLPKVISDQHFFSLPEGRAEWDVEAHLKTLASKNLPLSQCPSFVGGGLYRHHIPAAVDYLIQRGEFMTAYTPYQPEISQGTLQVLFEFQTQVARLTGMEIANASMYEGATAAAEAVMMARRINKKDHVLLSGGLHPHYRDVTQTYLSLQNGQVQCATPDFYHRENLLDDITEATSSVVIQCPSFFGHITDLAKISQKCKQKGALLILVFTEPLALALLSSFGEMGADIVVGEGQSFGAGLSFGGPGLGLFATKESFVRQMPGRLCGQTVDTEGRRGFVLTLTAREQHIRRQKATSNICTNAGLCALAFSIHMTLLGESGMQKLARLNHAMTCDFEAGMRASLPMVQILNQSYFNEFTIELPMTAQRFCDEMAKRGILAGIPLSRFYAEAEAQKMLLVSVTELTSQGDQQTFFDNAREVLK